LFVCFHTKGGTSKVNVAPQILRKLGVFRASEDLAFDVKQ